MSLRTWLEGHARVRRVFWAFRMADIAGPWHSILLAICRRCANNPRISPSLETPLPGLDPPLVAARLERDGWSDVFRLPAERVERILEFTERSPRQRYDDPHQHC